MVQKKKITQNVFFNIIKKEWDDLENDVIVNTIKSMQARIEACISMEGGHTKY